MITPLALTLLCGAAAPVDAERRADVPWSAAVLAVPNARALSTCTDGPVAALAARGARCTTTPLAHGAVVTLEGPSAIERELLSALAAREGVVFAELHEPAAPHALPARAPAPPSALVGPAQAGLVLKVAPGPSLWGLEGALLQLALEDALGASLGGGARVTVDAEGARAWLPSSSGGDDALRAARAAIDKLAARPPAPAQAERLWQRARGLQAARDAVVGARSVARARAWLTTGSTAIESDVDGDAQLLMARVRARLVSAAVMPAPQGAPAPLSQPAPASAPATPAR